MENTKGVQILFGVVLTLSVSNANAQKAITAEKHWIIETAKFNQSSYF